MNDKRKEDLHRRYLSRELSPEELQDFFKMLEEGDAEELADFDEVANEFPTTLSPSENLAQKILQRKGSKHTMMRAFRRTAAAVIVLLLTFGGFKAYQEYAYIQSTQTFSTIRVPIGKATSVLLTDGTRISLTAGSIFKYPKAFTRTARQVYLLKGQAFFDVAHDKTKPFTVRSGKLATTALGTSFIVRNYTDYGYENVSLYTGRVQIDRRDIKGDPVFLNPGQAFDYNKNHGTLRAFDQSNAPEQIANLDFKRAPFIEAIYSIASLNNVKILFNERAFSKYSVSGNFNTGTVEAQLRALTFIYPFKVEKIDSKTFKLTAIEKRKLR